MKIAFYESDITPSLYTNMPGYFNERLAKTIKDKIYAKTVLFESNGEKIAFVSIDANFITEDIADRVKKRVAENTDIKEENITVGATHLHNAGPTVDWGRFVKKDPVYISLVCDKAADAVIVANFNLKPARLRCGNGFLDSISFHRIYKMKNGTFQTNPGKRNPDIVEPVGEIDPDVTVMFAEDTDGKPLGCITNFACHQDCVDEYVFSGDYSSQLSNRLKDKYGWRFVSMFILGTCGNINHFDVKTDKDTVFEYYRVMGNALADEVLKTINISELLDGNGVSQKTEILSLQKRKVDFDVESEIEKLEKTVEFYDDEILGSQSDPEKLKLVFDYDLRNYIKDTNAEKLVPVKVFRVGDSAFYALPGEVFVEYGKQIKENSPFKNNFIITNSNGLFGYIPTKDRFMPTVYESKLGCTSYLEETAGEKIVKTALSLANECK
ncbi:MAG: hypothetical protein DBX47_01335 [Clostridiales bacterium]|nr:MAG: hypothetical protein DBX47_01335 [Clostridiales bacterium]